MKSLRYSPFFFLLFLFLGLTAFAFRKTAESRADRVRLLYLEGTDAFAGAAAALDEAVRAMSGTESGIDSVRRAFFNAREVYKRIEFLTGYFDRLAVGKVNGPPLPKITDGDMLRTVIDPEGFQVIEESLFGDDPVAARDELTHLTDRLQYRARKMKEFAGTMQIDDRYVFEAMREEVIRIAFHGLTGFDSPVALNSIPEAEASLFGLHDGFRLYAPDLARKSSSLAKRIDRLFEESIAYLRRHRDFDTFDRLAFVREFVNPLYADLLAAHYALGYPTAGQASAFTRPVRYESDNIFNADAMNPFFYSPDAHDFYDERQAALGRILFFDPVISGNGRRSCASCHNPDMAFTDGMARSMDITAEKMLGRNAPTLINVVFQSKYFWDGRTENLEHQIEDVLLNHSEMGATFEDILARLRSSPEYRRLFAETYGGTGDTAITKYGVTRGLATYLRTLTGLNSPFDRYMRGESDELDPAARRGFNLFMGKAKCGTCHFAPVFNGTVPPYYTETETEVLGVPATPDTLHPAMDNDPGRYNRYLDEIYRRSFKTPTVRNAELTAPYMHNGVYKTLEEVIDFYDRGGGAGMGLEVPNQTLPADRLNLTAAQKADLIAFMRSLTDTAGTTGRPARLPEFPEHPEWNGRNGKYE